VITAEELNARSMLVYPRGANGGAKTSHD